MQSNIFRSKSVISFDYRLGGISIQRVSYLGVLSVPSLNSSPHIDLMTSNAFCVLGSVRRHSINFSAGNCHLVC